ncbi:MAG: hypothetical protein E7661_03945 [Ruminococcaceae bacterium]|nr:hypothetical protein [Oscillospiraceae bacterium]
MTSERKQRFLQIKPLIGGALLGTFGALGFYCMIGAMFLSRKTHPYFEPFCIACGFAALIACLLILMWSFRRFSLVKRKVWILLGMLAATLLLFCLCVPMWEYVIFRLRLWVHPYLK